MTGGKRPSGNDHAGMTWTRGCGGTQRGQDQEGTTKRMFAHDYGYGD